MTPTQEASSSEARLQALVAAAVDAIISIDDRGAIQTFNPSAERMFGYTAEEVRGRNVSLLMPTPYQQEHDRYLADYLRTGHKKIIGIGREVLGLHRDGTIFPVELAVAEARVGSERVFMGIVRDIRERRRAQEELRRSEEQLWHAAKLASVGELAAGIAHELNNPLATVSLRIESILARTPHDDPRRKGLEIIEQETKRMADLVSNLLLFSRKGEQKTSTVDIRGELLLTVELVQHRLRKHLVSVVHDHAADTPIIFADRQKLRQVFLNIVSNASDAMPKGGMLTLRTRPGELQGRPHVVIDFIDTGVGIPSEHMDRLMEPFFTTKEEGKGTGLGLPICRRVVQEHEGTIRITSEVGRGTQVRVCLPVRNPVNTAPLQPEEHP